MKEEIHYVQEIFGEELFVDSVWFFPSISSDSEFRERFVIAGAEYKGKKHRRF